MSPDDLRVLLDLADPDLQLAWEDALEPHVLVVDDDPDVVLALEPHADHPTVLLGPGGLPQETSPAVVAAALWAVHHGLQVTLPQAPGPDLTPREHEVLELLALGMSNREIGDLLQISAHTAKFHVQGLLGKLDATTRTEAAVRAARMFLI